MQGSRYSDPPRPPDEVDLSPEEQLVRHHVDLGAQPGRHRPAGIRQGVLQQAAAKKAEGDANDFPETLQEALIGGRGVERRTGPRDVLQIKLTARMPAAPRA